MVIDRTVTLEFERIFFFKGCAECFRIIHGYAEIIYVYCNLFIYILFTLPHPYIRVCLGGNKLEVLQYIK
jgi:hypothetical protein